MALATTLGWIYIYLMSCCPISRSRRLCSAAKSRHAKQSAECERTKENTKKMETFWRKVAARSSESLCEVARTIHLQHFWHTHTGIHMYICICMCGRCNYAIQNITNRLELRQRRELLLLLLLQPLPLMFGSPNLKGLILYSNPAASATPNSALKSNLLRSFVRCGKSHKLYLPFVSQLWHLHKVISPASLQQQQLQL